MGRELARASCMFECRSGFTAECGEDLDSNISDWRYSFL